MFFNTPPSARRRRLTPLEYVPPGLSRFTYRPAAAASDTAASRPGFQLQYYEDFFGLPNPDEDRFPDRCETESDKETRCGKEIEESSESDSESKEESGNDMGEKIKGKDEKNESSKKDINEDGKQNEILKFDFKQYGKKHASAGMGAVETDGASLKGQDSASLHAFGSRSPQAADSHQFSGQTQPELGSNSTHRIRPDINQKQSTTMTSSEMIVDNEQQVGQPPEAAEHSRSPDNNCPTCGTSWGKVRQSFGLEDSDRSKPRAASRIQDWEDMTPFSGKQALQPKFTTGISSGRDGEKSLLVNNMDDFEDELHDINQDYRLLSSDMEISKTLNKEPIEIQKPKISEKRSAKNKEVTNTPREPSADDQTRYSTRSAVQNAEREKEKQRLANRRVTRNAATRPQEEGEAVAGAANQGNEAVDAKLEGRSAESATRAAHTDPESQRQGQKQGAQTLIESDAQREGVTNFSRWGQLFGRLASMIQELISAVVWPRSSSKGQTELRPNSFSISEVVVGRHS
nr:hypothetical protein CFP56_62466 [Quercus suber]